MRQKHMHELISSAKMIIRCTQMRILNLSIKISENIPKYKALVVSVCYRKQQPLLFSKQSILDNHGPKYNVHMDIPKKSCSSSKRIAYIIVPTVHITNRIKSNFHLIMLMMAVNSRQFFKLHEGLFLICDILIQSIKHF